MDSRPSLGTPRLVLNAWEPEFEEKLAELASNPQIMRYIGDGRTWDTQRVGQRHKALLQHWNEHGFGWRGILAKDSGRFLGIAALNYLGTTVSDIEQSAIEIGWWLDHGAWGRGIATEAAVALCNEAFQRLEATRIVARYQPSNHASERIVIKLGMHFYGEAAGKMGPSVRVYVLNRSDWQESEKSD